MPWCKPNPITGALRWEPTEQELLQEAVLAYYWLDRKCRNCGELAQKVRRYYDVANGDSRHAALVGALEKNAEKNYRFRG